MDGEAHVNSIPVLQGLESVLGHFAVSLLQNLQAAEMESRRKIAELEDRNRQCQLRVVRLDIEYHNADEDERGYISQQLEEAGNKLRDARLWLREAKDYYETYRNLAIRIKELAENDMPKARHFLQQKIDELNDYIGYHLPYQATSSGAPVAYMNPGTSAALMGLGLLPDCSGFEWSQLMSNDEVRAYLRQQIPPEHRSLATIVHISYIDISKREANIDTLGASLPLDSGGPTAIFVYKHPRGENYNKASMKWTIAHEVGHAVYFNILDRGSKSRWNQLSKESRRKDDSGKYGSINERYTFGKPEEDFAESYASYIEDPVNLIDVNKRKYNFLQDIVFEGREYR